MIGAAKAGDKRGKSLSIRVLGKYYAPFEGGIERVTRDTALAWANDHDVEVIAFAHEGGGRDDRIEGVRVRRFATQAVIASQPISIGYALAVLRGNYDLLVFHAPNVLANLALLIRKTVLRDRARLIVVHHMDMHGRRWLRAPARWLYRRLLAGAERVIVTSLKNAAISDDIVTDCKIEAIPLGIDPDAYRLGDAAREAGLKRRVALAGDAPLIGFVGRHARYKGLDVLLRALARLPGVHAAIAGDGAERAAAERLAHAFGIAERTHFLGRLSHDDKLALLASLDVFVFPSTETTEAFGIAQLEAMVMGAPIVASALPSGVGDISIDGETALTVPPGDDCALAAAIARLIDDRALAGRLAKMARAQVFDRFTVAKMTAAYRALVTDAPRQRGGGA